MSKSYEQLKQSMLDPEFPQATVVQILGRARDDESLDDWVRRQAGAWLDRLVDENGNPKDDLGRDPIQAAAEENALGANGTLTSFESGADRETLTFVLSHRARALDRNRLRQRVRRHLVAVTDELIARLHGEAVRGG